MTDVLWLEPILKSSAVFLVEEAAWEPNRSLVRPPCWET